MIEFLKSFEYIQQNMKQKYLHHIYKSFCLSVFFIFEKRIEILKHLFFAVIERRPEDDSSGNC